MNLDDNYLIDHDPLWKKFLKFSSLYFAIFLLPIIVVYLILELIEDKIAAAGVIVWLTLVILAVFYIQIKINSRPPRS